MKAQNASRPRIRKLLTHRKTRTRRPLLLETLEDRRLLAVGDDVTFTLYHPLAPGAFIEETVTIPASPAVDPVPAGALPTGGTLDDSAPAQLNGNGLEFIFNPAPGTPQAVIDGFQAAGDLWAAALCDDIVVNVDIDFKALPPLILGQTSTPKVFSTYTNFESALNTDRTSDDDDSVVANLQATPDFDLLINRTAQNGNSATPYFDNDASVNNQYTLLSRANAKAVGLLAAGDPAQDASITFSSGFSWDFDRSNGIASGSYDFVGVAAHEIGHALGFTSGVDIKDQYPGAAEDAQPYVSPLDMVRFSNDSLAFGSGVIDWTADTRQKHFSTDGGLTPLATFSTGYYFGDGRQASHWKDNLGIGIMDPTLAKGEFADITSRDVQGLDVIGWDTNVDLFVEDTPHNWTSFPDLGGESDANMASADMWKSRGITVQDTISATCGDPSDSPEFGQLNKVCVEVQNLGLKTAYGTKVEVYYAKAGASLHWGGPNSTTDPWELIGTDTLLSVPGGSSTFAEIEWLPPDPNSNLNDPGHFCLLARIVSAQDPIGPDVSNIDTYVRDNNNVAWRNVNIVDHQLLQPSKARFFVESATGATTANLRFEGDADMLPSGTIVEVDLGPLFAGWQRAGSGTNISIRETIVRVEALPAIIRDIPLEIDERYVVELSTERAVETPGAGEAETFVLDVVQEEGGVRVGGVSYVLKPVAPRTEGNSVHGVKWHDRDEDGVRDPGEELLPGWTVYVDTNGNGVLDPGEPSTVTMHDDPLTSQDETGMYWLDIPPGTATTGGNIFLTGHDVLLHSGQLGFDAAVLDFLRGAGTANEIPKANYTTAVIGSGVGFWSPSGGLAGYPPPVFYDTDLLVGNPTLQAAALSKEGLVILSHESCGGCDLDTFGSSVINAGSAAIAAAINSGMDLWANSSGTLATYYDFLPPGVVATGVPISGSAGFTPTPAGAALGLTLSNTNGFPTHNRFTGFDSDFTVFETRGDEVISLGVANATIVDGGISVGHIIREVPKPGWRQTAPAAGFHSVTLGPGEQVEGIDFGNVTDTGDGVGNFKEGEIHVCKFEDLNGNGMRDEGEPPMAGIPINLLIDADKDGSFETTITEITNNAGAVWFKGLGPGIYQVVEVAPPGTTPTTPPLPPINLQSGQVVYFGDCEPSDDPTTPGGPGCGGDPPETSTCVVAIPDDATVGVSVSFRNLLGLPISTAMAGREFEVQVHVEDLRPGGAGVYAAYIDMLYDSDVISLTGPVTYGPAFSDGHAGDAATPGLIDEGGGFGGLSLPDSNPALLFSVRATAKTTGQVVIQADPADQVPLHAILVADDLNPVAVQDTFFGAASIEIVAGSWRNPNDALDVNDDGFVTPIDSLAIINEINDRVVSDDLGRLSDPSLARPTPHLYFDANGDGSVTPIDALLVINQLNGLVGQGEGAAPSVIPPLALSLPYRSPEIVEHSAAALPGDAESDHVHSHNSVAASDAFFANAINAPAQSNTESPADDGAPAPWEVELEEVLSMLAQH